MRVDHKTGFTMGVPTGWRVVLDPSPEVAVAAYAPPDETGFVRNVTVTAGVCPPEWQDLHRWQEASIEGLWRVLEEPMLIDASVEADAIRQLVSYVSESRALTLEQWMYLWKRPDGVYAATVSVTMPTRRYTVLAEEAESIGWSFRPLHTGAES